MKGDVCYMGGEVCRRKVLICFLSAKVVIMSQCWKCHHAFIEVVRITEWCACLALQMEGMF